MQRVGLFQYGWALQSHTLNLARCLTQAGVEVDLYVKDCGASLVDVAAMQAIPRFAYHDFSLPAPGWLMERIGERLKYRGLAESAVRNALAHARSRSHDLYIGIEKLGLAWAGRLAEETGAPLVYYSLELYDEEHPLFGRMRGASEQRALEKHFHARARATIVQDEARGAWLLRSNGLAHGELITLPISVAGPPLHHRGSELRERFGVPPGRPILLYLGQFEEGRGCVRIAEMARRYAERLAVVFHGSGRRRIVRRLRQASAGRAFVSTDLVAPDRIAPLVSSADIGLAFYRTDCANDRLIASASEKLALYCQAGIPFIAQDGPSLGALLAEFPCGELVGDAEGIPAAAERILADYDAYRRQAYRAFEARYSFAAHEARLVRELELSCRGAA